MVLLDPAARPVARLVERRGKTSARGAELSAGLGQCADDLGGQAGAEAREELVEIVERGEPFTRVAPQGFPKLVALLQEFENASARDRLDGRPAYDFGWMWSELGLERPG